jgi:hypothetical protein
MIVFDCPGCGRKVGSLAVTTAVACTCGAVFEVTAGRAGTAVLLRRDEHEEIHCACGTTVAIGHIPRWTLLVATDGAHHVGELRAYPCPLCRAEIPIPVRAPASTALQIAAASGLRA